MAKKSNLDNYKKNKNNNSHINNELSKSNNSETVNKTNLKSQDIDFKSNNQIVNHLYKFKNYYIPLLVIVLTLFTYYKTFFFDFVNWDDDRYVTGNPYITEFSFENIKYFFSNYYFVLYIPFSMVSYMIDYKFAALDNPGFYHFHNVVLHIFNSILLFFAILMLIKKLEPKRAFFYATISSILFAIHPLHIESVTWVAERKDVLHTFYYFLAIIFYLYYSEKKQTKFYLLTLISFLFSLLSKTQAVTLPITLLLIDYLTGRIDLSKENFFKIFKERVIIEKIPLFILSAIFGIIAIFAISGNEPFYESFSTVQTTTNEAYPFYENVLYSCYSFMHYIFKILIPYNLSSIHPYPQKPDEVIPFKFWLYTIPVLLLIIYTIYAFVKKQKFIVFTILFFTANMILVLQLASVQNFLISEHYAYIPSVGIGLLLVFLYYKLIDKNFKIKPILNLIWIAYIGFLTIFSFYRNDVWENSLTLWNDVRTKYPEVIVAHYNRGNYNQQLGDSATVKNESVKALEFYNEAIKDYDETLNLQPANIGALSNRGIVKAKLNNPEASIVDFDAVIKLDSTYGNVFSNKGNALIMLQKWDEAIISYSKAIEYKPDFDDAYFNRGTALSTIGKHELAIADFKKCLEFKPNNFSCYLYLGYSFYSLKNYDDALLNFENYLKYDINNYVPYYYRALINEAKGSIELANSDYKLIATKFPNAITNIIDDGKNYENQGDYTRQIIYFQQAIEKYKEVLKINPNYVEAYNKIGVVQGKLGNIAEALNIFTNAIKIDSLNSEAYSNRAYANDLLGNTDAALKDYAKSIKLNDKNILSYFNRGILYMRTKKYDLAFTDFTFAINLDPTYSLAYLNRGIVNYTLNKKTEACNDWKKCLEIGNQSANDYISKYCN